MELREINFGTCLSTGEGFFGEGFPIYELLHLAGLDFRGSTFVARTTTLKKNLGHLLMRANGINTKEFLPRCILPNFRKENFLLSMKMFKDGSILNADGFPGPGAEALFKDGQWQIRDEPFFISFAPVADTPGGRLEELKTFIAMLKFWLPDFKAPVGLQISYAGTNYEHLEEGEALAGLGIACELRIPLMPKFSVLAHPKVVAYICEQSLCDAICVSSAIPHNRLLDVGLDPVRIFGSENSPLESYGGGGFCGKPLLASVAAWVAQAKSAGLKKPICAGGCVFSPKDVEILRTVGASSIFIDYAVSVLRPWQVQRIIGKSNEVF